MAPAEGGDIMGNKKFNISSSLYKLSRNIGRIASKTNDIETLTTGDPEKIIKRQVRKKTYKGTNKIARNINNKLFR